MQRKKIIHKIKRLTVRTDTTKRERILKLNGSVHNGPLSTKLLAPPLTKRPGSTTSWLEKLFIATRTLSYENQNYANVRSEGCERTHHIRPPPALHLQPLLEQKSNKRNFAESRESENNRKDDEKNVLKQLEWVESEKTKRKAKYVKHFGGGKGKV
ncbi:hypothetical protein RUM43_010799 [Polyplax serrata]|uniref:Uncharacterized protein n=1 Tax=Polyplax serrata TaxID=468196 RepID=A0AAN8RT27_POLSC